MPEPTSVSLLRDISLHRAEAVFRDALSSSTLNFVNPNLIHDELTNLKDLSSKLKFQYLEQETRDKFLRHILLEDEKDVSQANVDQLASSNALAKADLKQTKEELAQLLQESELVSEEVIVLSKEHAAKQIQVDDMLRETTQLQEELDSLLNEPENENYKTLLQMHKLIDTENIGLEEAMGIAENAAALEALAVEEIRTQVAAADLQVKQNAEMERELEVQIQELKDQLELIERLRQGVVLDPLQIHAQTLLGVNSVLQKFIGTDYEIKAKHDSFQLTFGQRTVVLDNQLNILTGLTEVSAKMKLLVNCAGKDKFWKLLRLLSTMICDQEIQNTQSS